jgi:hypothetical protein
MDHPDFAKSMSPAVVALRGNTVVFLSRQDTAVAVFVQVGLREEPAMVVEVAHMWVPFDMVL